MYVTFIFQMTCVNSVSSIQPDRLLCFQGYEIRLENSSTREIDDIACLKLATAATCLWGLTDVIPGSITSMNGCSCLLKAIEILGVYCFLGVLGFILLWLHRVSLAQNIDGCIPKISVLLEFQIDAVHDV